jgi:hypothetical protein
LTDAWLSSVSQNLARAEPIAAATKLLLKVHARIPLIEVEFPRLRGHLTAARFGLAERIAEEREHIRHLVRKHVEDKAQIARSEGERHARRLRELTAQQQKLVQLYYRDAVSEDVLRQNKPASPRSERRSRSGSEPPGTKSKT